MNWCTMLPEIHLNRTFKKYVNICILHTFYKGSLGLKTPNFSCLHEKAS